MTNPTLPGARATRNACTARHLLLAAVLCAAGAAQAQFTAAPMPQVARYDRPSEAETDLDYRTDAARHLYHAYGKRVFKGRMPPMLYGIAITDTEVDAQGRVVGVRLVRPPAAPEVGPWVMQMIRQAAPFPPPQRMGRAVYREIWLVDKGGNFQVDTLTEGQN